MSWPFTHSDQSPFGQANYLPEENSRSVVPKLRPTGMFDSAFPTPLEVLWESFYAGVALGRVLANHGDTP